MSSPTMSRWQARALLKSLLASWIIAATLAWSSAGFAQDSPPENNREHAYQEWKEGDYTKALSDYTKNIESDPTNYRGYAQRGYCYFVLRRWDKAIADFQKADNKNDWHSLERLLIWAARVMKGDGAAATSDLRVEIDRSSALAAAQKAAKPFPVSAPTSLDDAAGVFEKGKLPKNFDKPATPWYGTVARFLVGKISEQDFVPPEKPPKLKRGKNHAVYRPTNVESSDALFYAALKHLAEGDRKSAADYFERCAKSEGPPYAFEKAFATNELTVLRGGR